MTVPHETAPSRAAVVEQRSIEFVPREERYGKPSSLFTMWFGNNLIVGGVVTGGIAVTLGLSLPWTILAMVAGHLFGGVLMALHSAQGPKLGIPQMIQSRAQFGYVGAALPLLLAVIIYIGFNASGVVLAGQTIASLLHTDVDASMAVAAVAGALLTIFGYRLLHRVALLLTILSGTAFAIMSVGLLIQHPLDQLPAAGQPFAWGPFLMTMSLAVTYQLTYAPYVADYSRYLPEDTSVARAFWCTYAGTVVASVWMWAFGAVAATVAVDAFAGGSLDFIAGTAGFAPMLFLAILCVGGTAVNALGFYGFFMSTTTTVTIFANVRITQRVRIGIIVLGALIALTIAVVVRANFLDNFLHLLQFLGYLLIPWTSINLVDFYVVRRERYDIDAIGDPHGRYGGIDWRAIGAFVTAVAVELLFVSSSYFTGPLVDPLGGADISWIVGVVVAGATYYLIMRAFPMRRGHLPSDVDHARMPALPSSADAVAPSTGP